MKCGIIYVFAAVYRCNQICGEVSEKSVIVTIEDVSKMDMDTLKKDAFVPVKGMGKGKYRFQYEEKISI